MVIDIIYCFHTVYIIHYVGMSIEEIAEHRILPYLPRFPTPLTQPLRAGRRLRVCRASRPLCSYIRNIADGIRVARAPAVHARHAPRIDRPGQGT